MKNLVSILMFLVFIIPLKTNAQVEKCGADVYHEKRMQDPLYEQKIIKIQRLIKEQSKYRSPSCTEPLILPVAVHWNGGVTNSNMTCIMDIVDKQIDVLNEDFGGYNADIINYCDHSSNCPTEYPPNSLGGGTCIQFCIGTLDHPSGSGLIDGDYAMTFGTYTFTSGAALWAGYINFFVTDGYPPGYSGILGLAPLLGGANPDGFGCYISNTAFGGDNYSCTSGILINGGGSSLGRTATHEIGHYMGLPHVFGTASSNPTPPADCSKDFDEEYTNGASTGIEDTPQQSWANYGSSTIDYNTCVSDAHNTCGTQDFFFNYMDYSNDNAVFMFTSDQSDVINNTAVAGTNSTNPYKTAVTTCSTVPTGYSPTYPDGCIVANPAESSFIIDATSPYEYCLVMNKISFIDQSTNFPISWDWTFSGAGVTPTNSTEQNPIISVNSIGNLSVTLIASSNGGGPDPTPETMSYDIIINDPIDCGNCGEVFTDTGGLGGNYSNNENVIWTLCSSDTSEVVGIDFTLIDIPLGAGNIILDALWIKYGTIPPTGLGDADLVAAGGSVYKLPGYIYVGTEITSTESCISFRFLSDGSITGSGWSGDVVCEINPTCNDGLQNQGEEFVDCGGDNCSDCPTACNGFIFYDAGGLNNTTGTEDQEWSICSDDSGETVTVDFTTIDMTPFNNGVLRVYEGSINNGNSYDYYISGSIIRDSNFNPIGSSSITSIGQCFTFDFFNGTQTSNGWVADVTCSSPTPLSLISYEVNLKRNENILNWITANEVNTDRFIIQKSLDGVSFVKSGTKSACGNCVYGDVYTFKEKILDNRTLYYRLKMLDIDGSFTYSDVVVAKRKTQTINWDFYPNPGKGYFTLEINRESYFNHLQLFDKLGRLVYSEIIPIDREVVFLNLEHIEAGYYQLVLRGNKTEAKPIIILP